MSLRNYAIGYCLATSAIGLAIYGAGAVTSPAFQPIKQALSGKLDAAHVFQAARKYRAKPLCGYYDAATKTLDLSGCTFTE